MATKQAYNNGIQRFFESLTGESVHAMAPVLFYDDFLGPGSLVIPAAGSEESGMDWAKKIVGAAPPTVAGKADEVNGAVELALTSASQKQDAVLYFGDHRVFSLEQGAVFEARVKVTVTPTDVAEIVVGLAGDWADGPDAITYNVFFSLDGSTAIYCEKDDDSTDESADSGETAGTTTWVILRIDASDAADVKFYVDGDRVCSSTTFDYTATGADAVLQPYIAAYKASGAGVATVLVDYVRAWQKRS